MHEIQWLYPIIYECAAQTQQGQQWRTKKYQGKRGVWQIEHFTTALQVCNTCCPDNYCDDVLLKFDFDVVCSMSVRRKETEKKREGKIKGERNRWGFFSCTGWFASILLAFTFVLRACLCVNFSTQRTNRQSLWDFCLCNCSIFMIYCSARSKDSSSLLMWHQAIWKRSNPQNTISCTFH